jgi:hypothetical protein
LAGRVSVLGDDEYTAIHLNREDRRPSTVKITFRDGCTVEASRAIARGWPEDPMTDAELRGKYQILAEQTVSSARADRIWEIVTRLDELADVSELTTLLRSDQPAIEEAELAAAALAH